MRTYRDDMTMDKFEETMERLSTMSEDETTQALVRLMADCSCPGCPSYNDCAKQMAEGLFCSKGKSGCIVVQKGCECPACSVADQLELRNRYYCVRGNELSLRQG